VGGWHFDDAPAGKGLDDESCGQRAEIGVLAVFGRAERAVVFEMDLAVSAHAGAAELADVQIADDVAGLAVARPIGVRALVDEQLDIGDPEPDAARTANEAQQRADQTVLRKPHRARGRPDQPAITER